jgi:hypothetical protein
MPTQQDKANNIRNKNEMETLLKKFNEIENPIRESINKLVSAWRLNLDVDDVDTTLDEILQMSGNDLVGLSIEDLFKYQWILSKWALSIAVQENRSSVDYKSVFKKTFEDNLKVEMLKYKNEGTIDTRRAKALKDSTVLKNMYNLSMVAESYYEIFKGISDKISEMKNVLNRLIDYKHYQSFKMNNK